LVAPVIARKRQTIEVIQSTPAAIRQTLGGGFVTG
jgi:hypothetical protein